MFTSFLAKDAPTIGNVGQNTGKKNHPSDILSSQGIDNVMFKPILDYGQKLMNDQIIVKKILSDTEFQVYHTELRSFLIMKLIPMDEKLDNWIQVPPHTNIATCFDTFEFNHSGTLYKFSLSEMTNKGDIFKFIKDQNLNLGINISKPYMEVIYDCMIQITQGMEYAHNNGLVHGTFDLHNVVYSKDGETSIYKITNFTPGTAMKLPLTNEANFWPFIKGRSRISDSEKLEILMLKDIYSLGICLLELMIGRFSSKKFSISLDSLPLTWAEYAESTPLIQVLIECIQLDAITQRKGKLSSIRQMLIAAHAKFFDKTYYKMVDPYVGKKTDILNKLAIANLFQGNRDDAEEYWEQSIELNPKHYDTLVNYALYQWRYAEITDDQLKEQLANGVFDHLHKGNSLKGIIEIAIGEKASGIEILQEYNKQKEQQTLMNDPSENIRRRKAREQAREIYEEVNIKRGDFFQNQAHFSEHAEKITQIQFNPNGKYFVTTSRTELKIWAINPDVELLCQISIAAEIDDNDTIEDDDSRRVLATLDSDCIKLAIYKLDLTLILYDVDLLAADQENILLNKQYIDIEECWAGYNDDNNEAGSPQSSDRQDLPFNYEAEITDLRFKNEGSTLRLYVKPGDQRYFFDIDLDEEGNNYSPTFEKCKPFEDKSILKYGNKFMSMIHPLEMFIEDQIEAENDFAFPEKEPKIICILDNSDPDDQSFKLYDVFLKQFTRKIAKQDVKAPLSARSLSPKSDEEALSNRRLGSVEAPFATNAFDVDAKAGILIYAKGRRLQLQSIKMPESIKKYVAPKFLIAENKYSPARVQETKQSMRNKIKRDLKNYYQLGDNKIQSNLSSQKQNILQLLTLKYSTMCQNKKLIQANQEFLNMARVILKEPQPNCLITGIQNIIKLQIFEKELQVHGSQKEIKMMQLASQVPLNVVFVAMGGKVYKYDLVTKELLFEFNSFAHSHMMLYDFDDKLIVADSKQVRLWDFFNHKEEVPELVTVLESPIKIDCLKVNLVAERDGDRANVFYYVVACKDEFKIYYGRLDILLQGNIDNKMDKITSIEFGIDTCKLYIGTEKGFIHIFELPCPKEVHQEYKKPKNGETPKAKRIGREDAPVRIEDQMDYDYAIDIMYRITGVLEEDLFAIHVKHSGLWIWNADEYDAEDPPEKNRNRIECIEYANSTINKIVATPCGKFLCVGFPDANKVCFFSIMRDEINLMLLEPKITVEFDSFEADDSLGVLMFNNIKQKTLTLYAVQWIFNQENLDINQLKKMDEAKLGLDAPEQQQLEDDKKDESAISNKRDSSHFPEESKRFCSIF